MEDMNDIKSALANTVKMMYGVDIEVELAAAPVGVEADYASNVAMKLGKMLGKQPREVAMEIVSALRNDLKGGEIVGAEIGEGRQFMGGGRQSVEGERQSIENGGENEALQNNRLARSALVDDSISGLKSQEEWEWEVAGPGFINVSLGAKYLRRVLERSWSENYGCGRSGAGKKAVLEFPSQNMAKPYSVGHLRPGNQGWAVKNLLEKEGWEVITDNHLGDAGTPFGIWAVGFLDAEKDLNEIDVYDLGQIYIEMKKRLKDEQNEGGHELADRVQDWLLRLEAKDEEAVRLSTRFNEISLHHIHEVMGRLGISTDYELGESFYVERGKALVENYVKEGVFERNEDGSVICRLDEFGIEVPLLVLKSNGAALYATTDLATMFYRAEEWRPDLVVYCVGAEQKFYFEQMFAMGEKLGLPQKNIHLWFGTIDQMVDGKREKMSSRKGVVLMEELLDRAEEKARDLTQGREVSEEDVKKIAVGAIKFTDFVADRKTGILFDWEKIFALTGFSGPFCQYAVVRAKNILRKNADLEAVDYEEYDWRAEKKILKMLLEYPDVVNLAAEKMEAHRVAGYVFALAQEFNRYYEVSPVTTADNMVRSARLDLLKKVVYVLEDALGILGIEVPERM